MDRETRGRVLRRTCKELVRARRGLTELLAEAEQRENRTSRLLLGDALKSVDHAMEICRVEQ